MPDPNITDIPIVHEDERRIVRERDFGCFSIQVFEIKRATPLGNHYHCEKEETFKLERGSGKVWTRRWDRTGAKRSDLSNRDVIHVGRGIAHAFVLEPGSVLICFSTAAFDPADMIEDTLVETE